MNLRRSRRRDDRDRGAAAVEFALILPLLLLLVFGIVDFGRALSQQVALTQAAREGSRLAALAQPNVVARTTAAAVGATPVTVTVTACPVGAGPGVNATVRVAHTFTFVTPIGPIAGLFGGSGGLGSPINLTASGVMPCET